MSAVEQNFNPSNSDIERRTELGNLYIKNKKHKAIIYNFLPVFFKKKQF
jgi:hypothetical protein